MQPDQTMVSCNRCNPGFFLRTRGFVGFDKFELCIQLPSLNSLYNRTVDRLTEFIFLADIMIQFYTAVYDSKNAVWVTDRAEIRKIYFGNLLAGEPGDFWNHVVASFPYGLIGYLALGRATQGNLIICK